MVFTGIIIGAVTFLSIGLAHPLVIKTEYHFGKKVWWVYLLLGLAFCTGSLFCHNIIASTALGAIAFSLFWGIYELFEQEKRVLKGWFPMNPKRKDYYDKLRKDKN